MGMQTDNAPLEIKWSTSQLVARINRELDRLQRDVHELASRMDSMVPGADFHQHYEDHVELHEVRMERKRMWRELRTKAVVGLFMALSSAMIGVLSYALAAWFKERGLQ